MKKHELLKHAYDNYPKGSRFKSVTLNYELTSTGNFIILDIGKPNLMITMDGWEVYKSGIWAEIIVSEKPKTEDKLKEFEFEVGKWYWLKSSLCDVKALIYFNGHGYTYGFDHSFEWCNNYCANNSILGYNPTLATEQEVFEALKSEAVKRYIGKTPKCVHGCREIKHTNDFEFDWDGKYLRSYKTRVGANCLFHNGKWAEIIEEVKEIEIELNNGSKAIVHKVGQVNFEKPRYFLIDADIDLIKETMNKLK